MLNKKDLLPDRHSQLDFFICNILDASPKDDMGSMEHPVFSLSTKPDKRIRRYQRNGVFIEIAPGAYGIATIFDKDVLIYCISQLVEALNRGREVSRTLRVTAYDLLIATNRTLDGDSYQRLKMALDRLAGTRIKTNIRTQGKRIIDSFGIIDKYHIVEKSPINNQMIAIDITISEWLYNSAVARETLTLHRNYFRLRKALERRLYEIARKHCGNQARWKVSLKTLFEKSGSSAELKEFRRMVYTIIEDNNLPGYTMSINIEDEIVMFTNQDKKAIVRESIQRLLQSES